MAKKKAASNRTIAQAKRNYWDNYIKILDSSTKLGDIYTKTKKIKQKYVFPDPEFKVGDKTIRNTIK